jgi:glycosyltransferase involved in cell wall biosynthesis
MAVHEKIIFKPSMITNSISENHLYTYGQSLLVVMDTFLSVVVVKDVVIVHVVQADAVNVNSRIIALSIKMKLIYLSKYPPIEGGVSATTYWTCRILAEAGFEVHVVTNANEVEPAYKMWLQRDDYDILQPDFSSTSGGYVRVHYTEQLNRGSYIPWANPYVTKLTGLALKVAREYGCDLIYAHYFEPYAIVASLVTRWLNIPYVVRHAGSDIGRLALNPQLRNVYSEVLKNATAVITSGQRYKTLLTEIGAREESIIVDGSRSVPTDHFHPNAQPLEISMVLKQTQKWCEDLNYSEELIHTITDLNRKDFDPTLSTIGIYGKIGETKGTYDLVYALSHIKGEKFNFLSMVNGMESAFIKFLNLIKSLDITQHTWILPFMPHWRVPSFIRACNIVCFLERKFPIAFHTPTIPREVLACGSCLICSREVATNQFFSENIVNGKNLFIIEDPEDHKELSITISRLIDDETIRSVGYHAYNLSRVIETFSHYRETRVKLFTNLQKRASNI